MSLDSVKEIETNVMELTVSATAEQFEAACQKAYNKAKKRISVPGFRKGKATRKMVERVYGEGVFYEDALDIIYPEIVGEAIESLERKAVAAPYDLDIKNNYNNNLYNITFRVEAPRDISKSKIEFYLFNQIKYFFFFSFSILI